VNCIHEWIQVSVNFIDLKHGENSVGIFAARFTVSLELVLAGNIFKKSGVTESVLASAATSGSKPVASLNTPQSMKALISSARPRGRFGPGLSGGVAAPKKGDGSTMGRSSPRSSGWAMAISADQGCLSKGFISL
jgi:hypothetical protein